MGQLTIPCAIGQVSDGYHTFDELYEHRCTLFLALMKSMPDKSWISTKHNDGSFFEGWFIAGIHLPSGDVTYHLPNHMFLLAGTTGASMLDKSPHFDGHTPADVIKRLKIWIT